MSSTETASSAAMIIELVGGSENISNVTCCATRLRVMVKDKGLVKVGEIEALPCVVGSAWSDNQFQAIVGLGVEELRDAVQDLLLASGSGESDGKKESGKGKLGELVSLVVNIFSPLLPAFAGSGLLRGIIILCSNFGILAEDSTTYLMLYLLSNAIFYFLPLAVAYTTAKRLGTNPIMALVIVGTLLEPDFIALVEGNGGNTVGVFGLPVPMYSYTSSVLAPIVIVWVQSLVDRLLRKYMPKSLELSVTPTLLLVITGLLAIMVIGPACSFLSVVIADFVTMVANLNIVVTGIVLGGIWEILIMFGIHWAPNTLVIIPELARTGESNLMVYAAASVFSMGGMALAVFLRTKDRELKAYSLSSIAAIMLSGIVEPALYGIAAKNRSAMIAGCAGGAVGGAAMALLHCVGYSFIFPGLTTIPAFGGNTPWAWPFCLVVSFAAGFVFTFLLGVKGVDEDSDKSVASRS